MRTIILAIFLLFASILFAQNDSAFNSSIASTYTSINTLTRADVERLPALSFMELVQGAFPFVANESAIEEEYSFIVNGFLLINPNAINISQIESITFFPAGTNLTTGSSFKKGTFVITTRPGRNGLGFSTKSGLVLANNILGPNADIKESRNGFYSFNELAYSHRAKKWFGSSSFAFFKNRFPEFTDVNVSNLIKSSSELRTFRLSNFGGYEFNTHWKLEGGLFLTDKPQSARDSVNWIDWVNGGIVVPTFYTSKKTVDFGGAHTALTFSPTGQIKNQLRTEITKFRETEKDYQYGDFMSRSNIYENKASGRYTAYSFTDYFSWELPNASTTKINLSLLTRYKVSKSSAYFLYQSLGGLGGSFSKINSKSFLVNPVLNLSVRNILFAKAAVGYDTYRSSQFAKNEHKKLLPEAGVRFELSSLLKKPILSTMEISGNYSKYLTSFETIDRLEDTRRTYTLTPIYASSIVYANPSLYGYHPVQDWLGSLAIGIKHDRFVFKMQYREHDKYTMVYSILQWNGGSSYYYEMQTLKGNGWSFELKSSIIEKGKNNWKLYAMMFRDNYSIKYPATASPIDGTLLDAGKSPWRGGLKTSATIKRLFVQASALISFNESSYDKYGNIDYDVNRYNTNFLLVGYVMPLKKEGRTLEINAQSRSLFYSHSYPLSRYIGIGAQLDF